MRKRVLSGMRPSGKLHLGHFLGVLMNWKKLQEEHDCFFFVADWHALTTEYDRTSIIRESIDDMVIDWMASGIDPAKATLFTQSHVPAHAELHLLLSMITPLSWLERNPTYKEQLREQTTRDLQTYGFLGYPVLQAADILMYDASLVPVGIDQVPHLELTREIARRFNFLHCPENAPFFPEPKALLTEEAKLPGLDGRKMSKSYGNAIALGEPLEEIQPKIKGMLTDKNRLRKTDPGDPAVCNLYPYHKLLTDPEKCAEICQGCTTATWGCVDCKRVLMESLTRFLEPVHARRKALEADPDRLWHILEQGNERARAKARESMEAIRKALNFNF